MQIQNICDIRRFKLAEDVEREVGKLPKTLKESYDSIYESINGLPETAKLVAKRAISWLLCAQEPLESLELIAAITVDGPKQSIWNGDVLSTCCNLVVYDGVSQHFRFAHLSVREYLESRSEYSPAEIHLEACRACLSTWNIPELDRRGLPSGWVDYASEYLLHHLRELEFANHPHPGGLDINLQRFVGVSADGRPPWLDWAELQYNQFPFKSAYNTDLDEEVILSHPLILFAALGLSLAMDRILSARMLDLSQHQEEECVKVAALRNDMTTLKFLISNKFSLPHELILHLFEHAPGRLPKGLPEDQEEHDDQKKHDDQGNHRAKEIMATVLEAIPKITEDMLDAACRNETMSCEIVQQLFEHDPGLKVTQLSFNYVLLGGNIELCGLIVTRVSGSTISAKVIEEADDIATPICIFVSDATVENPKEMFNAIAGSSEPRLLKSFLRRTDFQGDWITERVLRVVGKNELAGKDMLRCLIDYEIDRVIQNAPFDVVAKLADPHVLNLYLSRNCDAPITWDILLAAARNRKDNTSLQLLLDQGRTRLPLTEIDSAVMVTEVVESFYKTDTIELLCKYGLLRRDDFLRGVIAVGRQSDLADRMMPFINVAWRCKN